MAKIFLSCEIRPSNIVGGKLFLPIKWLEINAYYTAMTLLSTLNSQILDCRINHSYKRVENLQSLLVIYDLFFLLFKYMTSWLLIDYYI